MSTQMSGWDVSSTPTWGSQDGPEDTQAFTAPGDGSRDFGGPDFGRGETGSPSAGFSETGSGFPGEGAAGGPPPEFFGQDYGQDQDLGPGGFPQRTPGRSLQNQDLPRRDARGRHSSAQGGSYGQESSYGQDHDPFGQEGSFGQGRGGAGGRGGRGQDDGGWGRPGGRPAAPWDEQPQQDAGYGDADGPGFARQEFGQESSFGQDRDPFGQPSGFGQPGGFGQDRDPFGQDDAPGQKSPFGQDGAFGQEGPFGQPNGFGRDRDPFGQPGGFGQDHDPFGQEGSFGQGRGGAGGRGGRGQDDGGWGRPGGRPAAPWDEQPQQDAGYGDADGPGFARQEFGQQDSARQAPRPGFTAHDYENQDFPGQQGRGPQEMPGFDPQDRDMAARMDPALQDFFAPQRNGGAPGYQDRGTGWTDEPMDSRYRPRADGWEDSGRPQAPRSGTAPRPVPRGPRGDDPEPRQGFLGKRGLVAIGAAVAIVVVVAAVMFTHKSGGSSPTASNSPAGGMMTTPAGKPPASNGAAGSGTKTSGGGAGAAAGAYTLSTPATAGGYPIGQDPNFLATATATANQITAAMSSGGGGTVKGNPVSAAYRLPASQVITFVGFQGTFTPAKIKTVLASLGTNSNTYQAGPNGGTLACANTKSMPSGAVCVWATSSTIGVTEFFTATGPETLNTAQSKGATDTVKLRADVEKKA